MERARSSSAAQEERKLLLQEYLAAKGKLKCSNTKHCLKDRTNHPHPLPELLAKPGLVARSKENAVVKGARGRDKPGARSTQRAGLGPGQSSSRPPQRAAVPERCQKSTQAPSTNPSTQPRGKLPASSSSLPSAGRTEEAAKGTVPAVTVPRAPGCLKKGLHERPLCSTESFPGQAPSEPAPSSALESHGDSHSTALAHEQTSATASRPTQDPRDTIQSHHKREETIRHRLGKALPGSRDTSQKRSSKTRVLQPPPLQSVSRTEFYSRTGAKPKSINTARPPLGKGAGTLPAGDSKHHSGAPQLKQPPAKAPACGGPQGAAKPWRCGPGPGSNGQQPRPTARGEAGRKDAQAAPPGRPGPARATGPPAAALGAPGSKIPALKRDFKTGRERPQPTARVQARRVPKTPTPEDRKKQLQEWLASKGKTYKRPPMMLPPKKSVNKKLIPRNCIKEEEEERLEQLHVDRINSTLSNCLKRIEEGGPSKGLLQMLARIPHIERFARFWVCRAKLLARAGPFDATGLYKDAVCAGAVPLQELREVILDILKSAKKTREGDARPAGLASVRREGESARSACACAPADPDRHHPQPGHRGEQAEPPGCEAGTPCWSERLHAPETPCLTGSRLPGSSIKLHLLSLPRHVEQPESHELTLMTPVRRSQRIERSASRYPRMLKDHDPVVSSLDEILRHEEESELLFRKNKALPEVTEMEILAL